ncbi:MAG: right-handed parallel beta-helix repeat-containing protein [Cytophagales bacterium]|nr:right-handed parallel beta-helix repeat-containing protein [Cytophagales bacterium]
MISVKAFAHPVSVFLLSIIGISFLTCKPEEEILDLDFDGGLEFSTDTILFDTVFSGLGSTTKRLKVYNPYQKAIKIGSIKLGNGKASPFNILVNGTEPGQSEEFVILGKDSVLILIEVFINPMDENSPYLVNDSIVFETNGKAQDVKLIAWGQDANYLGNEVLDCNTTWTNERPYVLFGSILIDSLCRLTIEEGTRVFGSKGANIFVKGKIHAGGSPERRILFRNERLDPAYENLPGQWGGIFILEGSHDNYMNFCIIRNAEYGIRLGAPDPDTIPDIILKNSIIENMSKSGILCFTSDVYAENVLVNNCIEPNIGTIAGGNYYFRHCTFANYAFNIVRQSPLFYATDHITLEDNSSIIEDLNLEIKNSIIDGNLEDELAFELSDETNSLFSFTNSMFRTTISSLDTLGNIINADPEFKDPPRYNYRLDTLSPAKDAGELIGVVADLDGNERDQFPDIGAYERIE